MINARKRSLRRPTTLQQGLILDSIQGHSTILCLKKEAVGLWVEEIICNQLKRNIY